MRVIGIDPGKHGALCVLSDAHHWRTPDGRLKAVHLRRLPQAALELRDVLAEHLPTSDAIVIEHPVHTPKQGHVGIATQWQGFGELVATAQIVADQWGAAVELVDPRRWQADMGVTKRRGESSTRHKGRILEHVRRFVAADMVGARKKVPGTPKYAADAVAIALWGLDEMRVRGAA